MSKLITFNHIKKIVEATQPLAIPLSRASDLSVQNYVLCFQIDYEITRANQGISDFQFLENIVSNINIEIGSSQKRVDLSITDHLLIMLLNRGSLSCSIPKSIGVHTATVELIIDMSLVKHFNPADTLFRTWEFSHRYINVMGGTFERFADIAINDVSVSLVENFKKGAKLNIHTINEIQQDLNLMRKPIAKIASFNGTDALEIDFPKNKRVLGCIIYSMKGSTKAITSGHLKQITIDNNDSQKFTLDHSLKNRLNRLDNIFNDSDTYYFDNIAYWDFAQGELTQAIHTGLDKDESTKLTIQALDNGAVDQKVKVIFLCTDKV